MSRRKILVTAVVIFIAGLVTVFGVSIGKKRVVDNAGVGELTDVSDKSLDFKEFKGKVVFVNNWASWCPPCIAEMPTINKLKQKLAAKDVVFVMVSFDADKEKAVKFMKRKDFELDVYFPGFSYPFVTSSIPATYILDKEGNVVSEHVGMADYSSDDVVKQLIKLADSDGAGK